MRGCLLQHDLTFARRVDLLELRYELEPIGRGRFVYFGTLPGLAGNNCQTLRNRCGDRELSNRAAAIEPSLHNRSLARRGSKFRRRALCRAPLNFDGRIVLAEPTRSHRRGSRRLLADESSGDASRSRRSFARHDRA
jgi:hypothetical protein